MRSIRKTSVRPDRCVRFRRPLRSRSSIRSSGGGSVLRGVEKGGSAGPAVPPCCVVYWQKVLQLSQTDSLKTTCFHNTETVKTTARMRPELQARFTQVAASVESLSAMQHPVRGRSVLRTLFEQALINSNAVQGGCRVLTATKDLHPAWAN